MEELTSDSKPPVRKRPVALMVIIGVVGVGLLVGMVLLQQKSTFMDYNYTLALAAKGVNLTCPKMVDATTRLDSVAMKRDKLFFYYYTLTTVSKATMDSTAFCDEWTESVSDAAYGYKDLAEFGKNGVTLIYKMNDKNASELCTVRLAPADYYIPDAN